MADFIVTPCGCPGCTSDPCNPTPAAPTPTLKCDSVSASKTKCGFAEFGTPSTPPKIYLTITQSGGLSGAKGGCGTSNTASNDWSGSATYSDTLCTITSDTRTFHYRDTFYVPNCDDTWNSPAVAKADAIDNGGLGPNMQFLWVCPSGCGVNPDTFACAYDVGGTVVVSPTQLATTTSGGSVGVTGSVSATLSSEYTTSTLIANAVAALPSFPGTYTGSCSSLSTLTTDEKTYTVRRVKFKFQLPTLSGFSCYRLTWEIWWVDAGGTPQVLQSSGLYQWNGSDTETPVYDLEEPFFYGRGNGTMQVLNVVASCLC